MRKASIATHKLTISVAPRQYTVLSDEAARLQLSISEIVRRMIDEHFDPEQPK